MPNWINPKTVQPGAAALSSDWNVFVRDNTQYLKNKVDELENIEGALEPAFAKNTAFNKNFGTTAGTVTEGNDARLAADRTRKITISSSAPTGGSDGDVWLRF